MSVTGRNQYFRLTGPLFSRGQTIKKLSKKLKCKGKYSQVLLGCAVEIHANRCHAATRSSCVKTEIFVGWHLNGYIRNTELE
jgi:hypothetical protein